MSNNSRRIGRTLVVALFSAVFFTASQSHAQTQNPVPTALSDAQCRALIQAFQSEVQANGGKSVTPSQAQLVGQCLFGASQAAAQASGSNPNAQAAALAQYLALQNQQPFPVPSAGQAALQVAAQTAPLGASAPLGTKKTGVVRIGVVAPQAQMGQGNSGINVAEPIRTTIVQYLSGPALEIVPIAAMISTQIEAEAKVKECDYLLYSDISQKLKGGAMGLLKKAGPLSSMIPGVGMLGGMTGAMAGAVAGSAVAGAASAASAVKAKADLTFDYKLVAPGSSTAVLANTLKARAKEDGDDVITPMIQQAATAILAEVTKPKK